MIFLKIASLILFVVFYILGGQWHPDIKKWIAPLFATSIGLLSSPTFSWLVLIGSLLYFAASNGFSYGKKFTHDYIELKILYRGLCGASYGLCGLLIGIGTNHILLGILQLILATASSILFGAFNPFSNINFKNENTPTILEDICISFSYIVLIVFMI